MTLTIPTKKLSRISNFDNLSTAMASDVAHIGKILMSTLDRETRKQMTVKSKLCYTDLKAYPSLKYT